MVPRGRRDRKGRGGKVWRKDLFLTQLGLQDGYPRIKVIQAQVKHICCYLDYIRNYGKGKKGIIEAKNTPVYRTVILTASFL